MTVSVTSGSIPGVCIVLLVWSLVAGCAADSAGPAANRPATQPATSVSTRPATQPVANERLIQRLRALDAPHGAASSFGPAYEAIYHPMLAWYAAWGSKHTGAVDSWMVPAEQYCTELADALEHGRNFIAENPAASFPLAFEKALPDGTTVKVNYLLSLPAGFPKAGQRYPLQIGLPGSGWLGHMISFSRGSGPGGRLISVTPINPRGPWQLGFLNAYLDELEAMLPVDQDRVYAEGHSLGAMGVWDWAMSNPERFAAISPRAGMGSTFRASRLKNVPAWVIHGSEDDSIPSGYAEQMVTAMRAAGGTAEYSLLKGAPHNLPPDFDQNAVIDWYLKQTRSHAPVPPDPIDALGIAASGLSPDQAVTLPEGLFWRSEAIDRPDRPESGPDSPAPSASDRARATAANGAIRAATVALFKKVQGRGQLVSTGIIEEADPQAHKVTLWLPIPEALRAGVKDDATVVRLPQRQGIRFYARDSATAAMAHVAEIVAKAKADGKKVANTVWVTSLTLGRRGAGSVAEYWVQVE
jgi:hypothetical protein